MPCSLSVSIVTYGVVAEAFGNLLLSLERAVQRALAAGALDGQPEVRLIDNLGEAEKLRPLLARSRLAVHYIKSGRNLGYGGAHNLAIRRATGSFQLLLNPDVLLHEDALVEGLGFLAERPKVALAGPRGFAPDGSEAHLCKDFPGLFVLWLRGFAPSFVRRRFAARLAGYERHDLSDTEPTVGVRLLSGCCLLARSAPLLAEGGFDERFFLYFEDFDLSLRLGKNWELAYVPAMKIVHQGGGAAGKGLLHNWYFCRSGLMFFSRYGLRA